MPKVVPLAGTLADPGENGYPAVFLRDVPYQFGNDDGLAHARAAVGADLASLGEGGDEVEHLDAGFENIGGAALIGKRRGRAVDRPHFHGVDGAKVVYGISDHVEQPAQRRFTDRHGNRPARVGYFDAACQSVGRAQGEASHPAIADVLFDFEHEPFAFEGQLQGAEYGGHLFGRELDVHNGADNLYDPALGTFCHLVFLCVAPGRMPERSMPCRVTGPGSSSDQRNCYLTFFREFVLFAASGYQASTAATPPMMSSNSDVIISWRALFNSSVRSSTSSRALSVAFCMATMRAECSLAIASNIVW